MSRSGYRDAYNRLVLPLLWGGSRALAPLVPKLRAGLRGRQGLIARVAEFRRRIGDRAVLLFHCASAGELEALRPLAQEFDRSRVALAVSYFSPSARALAERSSEFDFADYSPIDSAAEVAAYLDALQPAVIAITKHDIWPNLVWQARDRGIPAFLINGNFHARSMRLWPGVRQFHGAVYSAFREIMAVAPDDAVRARSIVGDRVPVTVVGDSRFDRVLARVQRRVTLPDNLEALCDGRTVVLAGSTHPDDEQLLLPVIPELAERIPDLLLVLVPHDPSKKARLRIRDHCEQFHLALYDIDQKQPVRDPRVVLVNRTGILADLYRLGQAAYVGGGFGKGVHSVLEPMASGLPVLTGPNIHVSNEARVAHDQNVLVVVTGRRQVATQLEAWLADGTRASLRRQALEFVRARAGAAQRIAARLQEALDARPLR